MSPPTASDNLKGNLSEAGSHLKSAASAASEAIKAGATHVVVGRPISRALNPAASFAALCAELEG